MDIVESINRYLAGSPVNKGERTRLTRARDEIMRLRKSPQPAQQCNHCNGSGRMVRDPDIGTDQECFVCEGVGFIKPEQPAQQEPVAWAFLNGQYAHIVWGKQRPDDEIHTIPLYTSPPASKLWVELDHDDIHVLMNEFFYPGMQPYGAHFANFARAIEAKLREKNA